MGRINRISETREKLRRAIRQLEGALDFDTQTLEIEILPETLVHAELEHRDYDSYKQLSLLWVETIKDGEKREAYLPNISRMIFRELEKSIRRINREEFRDKADRYKIN